MAISVEQLTERITASGLMTADEVTAFVAALPESEKPADAEALAKLLVKQKQLTPFQTQQIWKGKGQQLVLGNYVITDKLGQGGMGMVLKATHKLMKRDVALKVLSPDVIKDESAVQRFLREVEAAAKLTHPNIVAAHDADKANGAYFLIMEFVAGRDLSETVKKQGPATIEQAVDFILQAARGLEYAHQNGVVHRDIKPANLLLDDTGTVKVLDMGLARIEDGGVDAATQAALTGTGAIMGTVDYMAPEQAEDTKSAGPQADIYSLGASLYFLLTGKSMVTGTAIGKKLKMLMTGEGLPDSITGLRSEVSAELDAVFQKMTAFDMADRYQTMTEVIADLEAIKAGGVPSSASTPGIQPVGVRSDDSAMQSFLDKLGNGTVTTGPTALATPQAIEAPDTLLNSVDEATRPAFKKTATFTSAVTEPMNRKFLVGGGVAACLLVGTIIWGLSGEGDEPDLKMAVADAGKRTTSGTNSADPKAPTRKTKAVATIGPTTNQVALFEERELLPLVDLTSDVLHGKWKADGKGFVTEPESGKNVLRLPAEPAGSYSVRCEYSGHGHMQLVLPVEGRSFTVKCLLRGGTDAEIVLPNVSTPVNYKDHWFAYDLSKSHVLLVNVTQDGKGLVHVAASVDGTPRFDWKGLISETEPTSMGVEIPENSLALNAFVTGVRCHLHSVRLRSAGSWTENSADAANAPPPAVAPFNEAQAKAHQKSWADYLGVPVEKTVTLPGGAKMTFMLIPPGEFMMGASAKEQQRFLDETKAENGPRDHTLKIRTEGPQRRVRISRPYYLSKTETTQAQWQAILGNNPSKPASVGHPVNRVSWVDIQTLLKEINQQISTPGTRFTLPTEAQWEHACRAGTTTAWFTGNDVKGLEKYSWFGANQLPEAVGQLAANPWGLHDMLGNVVEWCADFEALYRPSADVVIDPTGPTTKRDGRVFRGGSRAEPARLCRCASRGGYPPDFVGEFFGFRLAMTIDPAKLRTAQTPRTNPDRAVAEWVLSLDGFVVARRMDASWTENKEVRNAADLPPGPLVVAEVNFTPSRTFPADELTRLSQLQKLKTLSLNNKRIDDDDLRHLAPLTTITDLYLNGTGITGAGLAHFREHSLVIFNCVEPKFSDEGLKQLSRMDRLQAITVKSANITNDGLKHLSDLSKLKVLDISNTPIDDNGLQALTDLKSLQEIRLLKTRVTAAGVAALQKALPNCEIDWDGIEANAPPPAKAPFNEAQAKAYQRAWAHHLGLPIEKEVTLPGSAKMTFMLIPPGEFLMGTPDDERARLLAEAKAADDKFSIDGIPAEGPQHRVRITKPFYLGKYEVTQAQWQAVMGNNPSQFNDNPTHPVERVSWNEIQPFLAKLNESTVAPNAKFVLPTEAQWEYACRSGTTTAYYSGDRENELKQYGWFNPKAGVTTHPVGELRANGFGLYDMHGNVGECCADLFASDYYAKAPVDDPSGPPTGTNRVISRGGYWGAGARICRSASRWDRAAGYRSNGIGFRLAMTINTAKTVGTDRDRAAAEWVLSIGGSLKTDADIDQAIEAIGELPREPFRMTEVDLRNNLQVTDADLRHLQGLTELVAIDLLGTNISDAGLEHIKELTSLEILRVPHLNSISNAGLKHIKELTNLESLTLSGTSIDNDGLRQLGGLTRLKQLRFSGTQISDAGLVHLKPLLNLEFLNLDFTKVSDGGLEHLLGLTKLKYVKLRETKVTAAGVAALQKALPDCKIEWDNTNAPAKSKSQSNPIDKDRPKTD